MRTITIRGVTDEEYERIRAVAQKERRTISMWTLIAALSKAAEGELRANTAWAAKAKP